MEKFGGVLVAGLEYYNGTSATEDYKGIIDIQFYYNLRESHSGYFSNNTSIKLETRNCLLEDFFPEINEITESEYLIRGFDKKICITKNSLTKNDVTLLGNFASIYYNNIEITYKISDAYKGSLKDLDKKLNKAPLRAPIYFMDNGINFEDYEKPLYSSINYNIQYLDVGMFKKIDVDFAQLFLSDDQNILFERPEKYLKISFQKTRFYEVALTDRSMLEYSEQKNNLLVYYVQLCDQQVYAERTYQKFTEFIADTTGILSQILFMLIVVFGYTNSKLAFQKIMNKIVHFEGRKGFEIIEMKNQFQKEADKKDLALNSLRPTDQSKFTCSALSSPVAKLSDLKVIKDSSPTKRLQTFNLNMERDLTKSKKLRNAQNIKFKTIHLLCPFVGWCCKKYKVKDILITKVEAKINYYLDIMTFVKKMKEFDNLKQILLTKDQLVLFNFLGFPVVKDDFDDLTGPHNNYQDLDIPEHLMRDLITSFQNLKNNEVLSKKDKNLKILFNQYLGNF